MFEFEGALVYAKTYQNLFVNRDLFIIFSFVGLFFCSFANSQQERPTTFDDKKSCEATSGVWREFGNECADSCESKFEKIPICTKRIFFGCDCGKTRCFDGFACVAIEDYWKANQAEIYAADLADESSKQKRAKQLKQLQIQRFGAVIPNSSTKTKSEQIDSSSNQSQVANRQNNGINFSDSSSSNPASDSVLLSSNQNLSSVQETMSNKFFDTKNLLKKSADPFLDTVDNLKNEFQQSGSKNSSDFDSSSNQAPPQDSSSQQSIDPRERNSQNSPLESGLLNQDSVSQMMSKGKANGGYYNQLLNSNSTKNNSQESPVIQKIIVQDIPQSSGFEQGSKQGFNQGFNIQFEGKSELLLKNFQQKVPSLSQSQDNQAQKDLNMNFINP